MRILPQRPLGRLALGAIGVVLVAAIAASIYVFGGGGGASNVNSKPPTVPTLVATSGETIYTLDSSASQATFTIHEVLLGNPNTVVGKTNAVAGQILVDEQDPAKSQIGEFKVDLSTLVTDSDLRNQVIQGRILETSDPSNQYATFVASAITGMPATVAVGQQVTFAVTGALTIHQVTRTETFQVQLTPQSQTVLVGTAQTTVKYEDFNLAIPSVPTVTGVTDAVVLALSFTART